MSISSRLSSFHLRRLFAASALVQGLGMIATVLLGIQLARYLGPAQFGIYGLVLSAVSILSVIAQFGLPVLAIRCASSREAVAAGQRRVLTWFVWRTFLIAAVTTAVSVVLFTQLFPETTAEIGMGVILLGATMVVSFAMLATVIGVLRGGGDNLKGQVVDILLRPACISLFLLIIYLALHNLSVAQALLAQVVVAMLGIAIAIWLMRAKLRTNSDANATFRPHEWAAAALSFSASSLLIALNGNYPMIVSGFYASPTDLGILRVALSSVMLLALPASIANIAVGPVLARLAGEGDEVRLHRTVAETTLLTFGATLLVFIGFALIGKPVISFLFGAEYIGSYGPLLALGVSQVIVAAFGTSGTLLNMTGQERIVIKAFAISVPIGMIAGLFLVKSYGIMGAAFSNIVMVLVWHLYIFGWNRRITNAPVSLLAAWAYWRKSAQPHQKEI